MKARSHPSCQAPDLEEDVASILDKNTGQSIDAGKGKSSAPRGGQQQQRAGAILIALALIALFLRSSPDSNAQIPLPPSLGSRSRASNNPDSNERHAKRGFMADDAAATAPSLRKPVQRPPAISPAVPSTSSSLSSVRDDSFMYPLSSSSSLSSPSPPLRSCRGGSSRRKDAKVAIVLQGKYTRGYLNYCLLSIERAFSEPVDVFIYATYEDDKEREELVSLLDREIIASALIEQWDGDLHRSIIGTYTENNGGVVPSPPCCVKGCCVAGPDPCKAKHCSVFGSKGVAAAMLSLYRAYRMAMLVYERYRAKVRKNDPYRIMIRARMDTVFPVIDKGVKWGTEVADAVQASPVEIWVPFASDGNLEGGISDKVSVGRPEALSHIFRDIAGHVGDEDWGTSEMAEIAMWRSIVQEGWEGKVGRFHYSAATVRLELGVPKFKYNDNHKQFHRMPKGDFPVGEFKTACREGKVLVSDNPGCVKGVREVDDEVYSDQPGALNIPKSTGLDFCGEFMKDRGQQHEPRFLSDKIEDWD